MKTNSIIYTLVVGMMMYSCDVTRDSSSEISPLASEAATTSPNSSFSVLTYNVAGLPGFLSSGNPEENTATIGALISDYDIIHVQEDFNYHATLYANDTHSYRTPTSGGVPFGDGINTMSNFPFTDFQRIQWNDCNGTDCLTPKGFSVARHMIAPGVYIDFYNAHPNAGVEEADLAARRSNILQLKDFIASFSEGNAVIVMGDMNCRYTRAEDNIRELANLGLTDVWVQLIKGGTEPAIGADALVCDNSVQYGDPQCEIVDKVFYRSNNYIQFIPSLFSYEEAKFRDNNGDMLSDHRPIHVNFTYSLNANLSLSEQFGGPHGNSFNDTDLIPENPVVNKVFLRAGSRLDQVGISLAGGAVLSHGGDGGTYQELVLGSGEYVNEVTLYQGQKNGHTRIFRSEFRTNLGRTIGGGNTTSESVTFTAPAGWQMVGFHGRVGSEVDKLGVIFAPYQ